MLIPSRLIDNHRIHMFLLPLNHLLEIESTYALPPTITRPVLSHRRLVPRHFCLYLFSNILPTHHIPLQTDCRVLGHLHHQCDLLFADYCHVGVECGQYRRRHNITSASTSGHITSADGHGEKVVTYHAVCCWRAVSYTFFLISTQWRYIPDVTYKKTCSVLFPFQFLSINC